MSRYPSSTKILIPGVGPTFIITDFGKPATTVLPTFSMAQQYRIKIINDSGITQAYYLFQAPPILSPSADIFTNIYGVSPIIQGDGNSSITFTLNDTFYAVNGVPPAGGLHPGVTISSSSHADVALGDSQNNGTLWNLTTSPKDGSPLWLPPPTTVEAPGGFGIKTDSSFQFPDPGK